MPALQTFTKEERLTEKTIIEELFESADEFYVTPFKVIWKFKNFESRFPAKVMMVVPRKNFSKATDRNRLKRLMREAYRKNKNILYEGNMDIVNKFVIILIFTGKTIFSYKNIESKIILILQRLHKEVHKVPKV